MASDEEWGDSVGFEDEGIVVPIVRPTHFKDRVTLIADALLDPVNRAPASANEDRDAGSDVHQALLAEAKSGDAEYVIDISGKLTSGIANSIAENSDAL